MILNQAKLAHFIKQLPEYQAFPEAEIELHYLEGEESIRYQAELFWNASMLIWPHGATMAHTIFLPRVRRGWGWCWWGAVWGAGGCCGGRGCCCGGGRGVLGGWAAGSRSAGTPPQRQTCQ